MKKIALVFIATTMVSCAKKAEEAKNETPEALKEEVSFKRYSRGGDMVDDLYEELVAKSPELQGLEKEIEDLDISQPLEKFGNYNAKSVNYYASAKDHARAIKDSVTKNKMLKLIMASNAGYTSKSAGLQNLAKTIGDKRSTIEDSHNVLKIMLTLAMIESYQNESIPDKRSFEEVIEKEDSLNQAILRRASK